MPANAIMGPVEVLEAAAFMASAWAPTNVAAAILALRITAVFCRSLIIFSSSSGIFTLLKPIETISIPRRLLHFSLSTSFRAWAMVSVLPASS